MFIWKHSHMLECVYFIFCKHIISELMIMHEYDHKSVIESTVVHNRHKAHSHNKYISLSIHIYTPTQQPTLLNTNINNSAGNTAP